MKHLLMFKHQLSNCPVSSLLIFMKLKFDYNLYLRGKQQTQRMLQRNLTRLQFGDCVDNTYCITYKVNSKHINNFDGRELESRRWMEFSFLFVVKLCYMNATNENQKINVKETGVGLLRTNFETGIARSRTNGLLRNVAFEFE